MVGKKNNSAYKTISEVSKEVSIPMHILRFWETKFDRLQKVKRQKGHRYYNAEDIIYLIEIKNLIYKEGYTIKGVQKFLKNRNKGDKNSPDNKKFLAVLCEIRDEIEILIKNK